MINYYSDFALYSAVFCYLYSITQIPIGDAITRIVANLVLQGRTIINKLHCIAVISEVNGIVLVTRQASIFNSCEEDNNTGKEFEYYTAVAMKTIQNMNKNYVCLRF